MNQVLNLKKLLYLFIATAALNTATAQTTTSPSPLDTTKKPVTDTAVVKKPAPLSTLTFGLDMRTRAEARHGYRAIPLHPIRLLLLNISQRTRFNVDYKSKKLDVFLSLQDASVWGDSKTHEKDKPEQAHTVTPTSTFPLYFFEAYAEPHFGDKWSLRIGRQRIIYDNQRLFAENDWRLPGNSHDAMRLIL